MDYFSSSGRSSHLCWASSARHPWHGRSDAQPGHLVRTRGCLAESAVPIRE
jgi:hypothetical protein